jgi:hypothetical protein
LNLMEQGEIFNRHLLISALTYVGNTKGTQAQCIKLARLLQQTSKQYDTLTINQPRVTSALPFSSSLLQRGPLIQTNDKSTPEAIPMVCITPTKKVITCELLTITPAVTAGLMSIFSEATMQVIAKKIHEMEKCETVTYNVQNDVKGNKMRVFNVKYSGILEEVHFTLHETTHVDFLRSSPMSNNYGIIHISSNIDANKSLKIRLVVCYDLLTDTVFCQFYKHATEDYLAVPSFLTLGISIMDIVNSILITRPLPVDKACVERLKLNACLIAGTKVGKGLIVLPFSTPAGSKPDDEVFSLCQSIQPVKSPLQQTLQLTLRTYIATIEDTPPLSSLLVAFNGSSELTQRRRRMLYSLLQVVSCVPNPYKIQFMGSQQKFLGGKRKTNLIKGNRTRRIKPKKSRKYKM